MGNPTNVADETQTQGAVDQGGSDTPQATVSEAELDALFDQVSTAAASSDTPLETPESGDPGTGQSDDAGKTGQTDGAAAAADSSTPPSGSPASGDAPASSAPQANGAPSPAAAAPGGDKGASAPTQKQPAAKAPAKTGQITLEEKNRRLEGRIAALNRDNEALRNKTSTPTTSPAPAPANGSPGKQGNEGAAPKSRLQQKLDAHPKWQAVKKDYDEIAAPLEEILGDLAADVEDVRAHGQQQNLNANGEIVARAHPDAGKIVSTKPFNDWLASQPRYVVDQVKANGRGVVDPDACIDIFNRFKSDTGYAPQASPAPANHGRGSPTNDDATLAARNARKDGAIAVGKGRGGQTTQEPTDPDALFDHLAAQDAKRRGQKAA